MAHKPKETSLCFTSYHLNTMLLMPECSEASRGFFKAHCTGSNVLVACRNSKETNCLINERVPAVFLLTFCARGLVYAG